MTINPKKPPKLHQPGDLVKVNNREHPWHDNLGTVREVNEETGFHLVDLVHTTTWLPAHWLVKLER